MNISIVVFSPTGNTLKVGRMLAASLQEAGVRVQLLDVTRQEQAFRDNGFRDFLNAHLEPHDVLCIGGPVYAHHMQYNVLDLIASLDPPNTRWGSYAVPFATYGTVSSGVALAETAHALHESGRIPALAMKIDARHCYSEIFGVEINEGMPGQEAHPHVQEFAHRIMKLPTAKQVTNLALSSDLYYLGRLDRWKAKTILRERLFHRVAYPKLRFDPDACTGCARCVDVCPVGRLSLHDGQAVVEDDCPACIHCGACITTCTQHAIQFSVNLSRWARWLEQGAAGKGFIASNEVPKSAVYPLQATPEP